MPTRRLRHAVLSVSCVLVVAALVRRSGTGDERAAPDKRRVLTSFLGAEANFLKKAFSSGVVPGLGVVAPERKGATKPWDDASSVPRGDDDEDVGKCLLEPPTDPGDDGAPPASCDPARSCEGVAFARGPPTESCLTARVPWLTPYAQVGWADDRRRDGDRATCSRACRSESTGLE
jgi:hypothetical protein